MVISYVYYFIYKEKENKKMIYEKRDIHSRKKSFIWPRLNGNEEKPDIKVKASYRGKRGKK